MRAGAGDLGAEVRFIHAVRDLLLRRPEDGFVEIVARLDVHEGIVRALRLGRAGGAPQERDDLSARAGILGRKGIRRCAVCNAFFCRPFHRIGVIHIDRHIIKAGLRETEQFRTGQSADIVPWRQNGQNDSRVHIDLMPVVKLFFRAGNRIDIVGSVVQSIINLAVLIGLGFRAVGPRLRNPLHLSILDFIPEQAARAPIVFPTLCVLTGIVAIATAVIHQEAVGTVRILYHSKNSFFSGRVKIGLPLKVRPHRAHLNPSVEPVISGQNQLGRSVLIKICKRTVNIAPLSVHERPDRISVGAEIKFIRRERPEGQQREGEQKDERKAQNAFFHGTLLSFYMIMD